MNDYTPIIGMEIHVELATVSKMFCGCKNDPFYASHPNMYTCPTCLGLPGGLPVPNRKAIEWTLVLGLALGCDIAEFSKFDRKNYFYPDLAKGYQISQYDQPFCTNGLIRLPEGNVRIHRVHLEEDTGKLLHMDMQGEKATLIDFNRSGVPLVEIVTEPDIRSGEHAKSFLKKLHQIIRYLNISGADMEKGSMRLEPNISVMQGEFKGVLPAYKVEVKNINSFNFVKRAIDYEINRHVKLLTKGIIPVQETRGYVEATSSTISQRSKENAEDYRYFPEPDIAPFRFDKQKIATLKSQLPELPDEKITRFQKTYRLPIMDCVALTETKDKADFFENCISLIEANNKYSGITSKDIANVFINKKQDGLTMSPHELLDSIMKKIANRSVDPIVIMGAIQSVISEQNKAVEDFRKGKTGILMFLVGQVLRKLQGKGDPETIRRELLERISF